MKILQLKAENVKRLKAVEIKPDGNVVVIGGKNGAGKSSVLDSIEWALAGKRSLPGVPVRRGEKSATIVVELDGEPGLIVKRTITAAGKSQLTVTTANGMRPTSPQALLDSLCGEIAFDPHGFIRQKPGDQAATLRELVGLDFTGLDAEHNAAFDARTLINRDAKALRARLDATPKEDAPEEEVSVADLVAEMQRRQEVNTRNTNEHRVLRDHGSKNDKLWRAVDHHKAQIAKLEEQLKSERASLRQWTKQAEESDTDLDRHGEAVAKLVNEDITEIQVQIEAAEGTNQKVRSNQARAAIEGELTETDTKATKLTARLAAIAAEKQTALAAAEWPVDGLGFDEHGVTFHGLPFGQASSAEQLRVSVAMGLALNPELRVLLVRDGSLLDADSMALLAELAEESDAQVWVETVSTGEECAVIIEDGAVKADVKA